MRKWLPVFAAVICCALIAGCAAGFSVEEAAPADELEHLVRRMELAVNPGKNAIPDRFRIFFRTHIRGLGVLARKHGVPIYANEGTWDGILLKDSGIPLRCVRTFYTGEDFYIGGVNAQKEVNA